MNGLEFLRIQNQILVIGAAITKLDIAGVIDAITKSHATAQTEPDKHKPSDLEKFENLRNVAQKMQGVQEAMLQLEKFALETYQASVFSARVTAETLRQGLPSDG